MRSESGGKGGHSSIMTFFSEERSSGLNDRSGNGTSGYRCEHDIEGDAMIWTYRLPGPRKC